MQQPGAPRSRARRVVAIAAISTIGLLAMAPSAGANWFTVFFGFTATTTPSGGTGSTPRERFLCFFGKCPTTTTSTSSTTTTTSTTAPTTTTTTGSTTTTSIPEGQPDCGPAITKPGGGQWTCAFDDEFTGVALDRTKWMPQLTSKHSFEDGPECFVDSPNNIAVEGGALHLTVRKEDEPFDCAGLHQSEYTSGMVTTNPVSGGGFAQTNGRYEIRAKFPASAVAGLHSALWMWPVTPVGAWPSSGEIDIAEIYSKNNDRAIPYIHYSNPADPNRTNNYCLLDVTTYHDYVLEWTPQSLKISYDGAVCIDDPWQPWLQSGRKPFDQPFYLVLTQALGIGNNAFDPESTPLPATMDVEYVRIWK